MGTSPDAVRSLFDRQGTVRSRELEAAGLARAQISRMVEHGSLVRVARGLYALPDQMPGADDGILIAATRAPNAIFCLLTALRIHGITTQAPFELWIGIGNKDRAPRLEWPPLRVVRFTGESLEAGVEVHDVAGVPVRVTGVARTVVDCFKFRNKIGLDVAIEALRDAHTGKKTSMNELWHYATLLRVANVMRPYLAALA